MDFKIHFGLNCVIVLLFVCHAICQTVPSSTNSTTNGTLNTTTPTNVTVKSSPTPTNLSGGSGGSQSPTQAPKTPAQTTPALINCMDKPCPGNCSTFTTFTTCQSDTTRGCQAEKTTGAKGVDTTFSCSQSTFCTPSGSTVYCCFEDNCNPLTEHKKSKATTIFGNLVSITIIVVLAFYV